MGSCEFCKIPSSQKGTLNKNNFAQQYVIGRGGYGKVWKVKNKRDNKEYAMKEMSKAVILAKTSVTSINFERDILSRLKHQFICNICYAFQDIENLYLVVELSNGGDLRYHLFKSVVFNEEQTRFIAANLILALEYLHSNAIIHRDLKPENILFSTNGYIKLTDFGIARTWSPNNSNDTSGTPGYMAPEVVFSKPHGFGADFWALGVILYELMFGRRPYPGIRRKEYKENLSTTNVQIKLGEQPEKWSEQSVDIINQLLQRKEEMRLGAKGVDNVKEHPWFKDLKWEDLLSFKITAPFIPMCTEDCFDESYLKSFEISTKLKEDINQQTKAIKDAKVQKLFKDFYYDKDASAAKKDGNGNNEGKSDEKKEGKSDGKKDAKKDGKKEAKSEEKKEDKSEEKKEGKLDEKKEGISDEKKEDKIKEKIKEEPIEKT